MKLAPQRSFARTLLAVLAATTMLTSGAAALAETVEPAPPAGINLPQPTETPYDECPEGTINIDGECQPKPFDECPEGTVNVDGECFTKPYDECPDGTVNVDGECVTKPYDECPDGTVNVDGECVTKPYDECPEGTVNVDGECVTTSTVPEQPEEPTRPEEPSKTPTTDNAPEQPTTDDVPRLAETGGEFGAILPVTAGLMFIAGIALVAAGRGRPLGGESR